MKSILYRLCFAWAMLVFAATMIPIMPAVWISGLWPEPRRTDYLMRILRGWMSVFFLLAGVRIAIRGRERFGDGRSYIVICNHNTLMDVPISSPGIPGANKTIAKVEMASIPVFGVIYRRGAILVDRKSDQSRRESYGAMKAVLEAGMHMCIYPEGTRNRTGKPLKDFHEGAFRLAVETRKPLMPAVILGSGRMLPNDRKLWFRPGRVEMHFLEPIEVTGEEKSSELRERAFRIMWDYYERHNTGQFE